MSDQEVDISALKDMLYLAHVIIDERGLYDIWERIPESGDPDFKGNSFAEFTRQNLHAGTYSEWSSRLEDIFLENRLSFLRFKMATMSGDARETSKQPAYLFLQQVKELDRIIHDQSSLRAYATTEKAPASWPAITYKDGLVMQGRREHRFTNPQYIKILNFLWDSRRIETPSGDLIHGEKRKSRELVNQAAGITRHERFAHLANGIRKAMREKSISLKLMYPDQVFLIVRQSRK